MATVIFYNFILLSSTFFVWLSDKGRTSIERWLMLCIAFLLVFIPSAIRYDIGTDYLSYLSIYESGSYINYQLKEPAFYFINWFLDSIGAHFQWLFAVFAFIFTAVAFKAYPRKNAWLLHFLFFSMLWFFSFNGIRQAIALSWCMLALFYYFDKRYGYFVILTLMGSFFHQSAIFVTFSGLLALIPLRSALQLNIAPIIFLSLLTLSFLFTNTIFFNIEMLLKLVGLSNYAAYFSNKSHFVTRDFGSGLGILAKLLFSIYIILNSKRLLLINRQYWIVIITIFAYALASILAMDIVIFERMVVTFSLGPLIGGYLLTLLPKNKLMHTLMLCSFVMLLLLSFIKESFSIETTYSNPKRNPYQSIFTVK